MSRIFNSLSLKIGISVLLIQSILLTLTGVYFCNRFSHALDDHLVETLEIPTLLMSQGALSSSCVDDLSILSDLLKVEVLEAFIYAQDGTVTYSSNPDNKGKYYLNLLNGDEQHALLADVRVQKKVTFIDHAGQENISSLSPLTSNGEYSGSVYIRINGEPIKTLKKRVALILFFGALAVTLLTAVGVVLLVNRMVMPRLRKTSVVVQRIADGDFSARIEASGPEDQIGIIMDQVNSMISTIQNYTRKLQILNSAAEKFAYAKTKEDIIALATELIEQQLCVVRDVPSAGHQSGESEQVAPLQETVFTLPVMDDDHDYQVLSFVAAVGHKPMNSVDRDFIETMSRMVNAAIEKAVVVQNISVSEARYRHLFTNALEGILRISPDGHILEANPALASMTGYDSVEDLIDQVSDIGYQVCDDSLVFADLLSVLEIEDRVIDRELNLKRKDGVVFPVSLSAYSVRDDVGRLFAFDIRLFNIIERKRREQAERDHLAAEALSIAKSKLVEDLEWKNRQLVEALNELKATQIQLLQSEKMAAVGTTAGGVAHDLNNILSGIVSYPELLLDSMPENDEMIEPLNTILSSGRRAAAIVDDLMALTQGVAKDRRKVKLEPAITELLHSIEFTQLINEHENVELELTLSPIASCIVCSHIHLKKMIINIVRNALANIGKSGKVSLSTAVATRERGIYASGEKSIDILAVIRIKDNGPRIPEENLRHIFEPFYTRNVMRIGGTGLGLTVAWNIVNEYGGKIDVTSDNDGTEFSIYLPVSEGCESHQNEKQPYGGDLQGRGKILVIDEEPLQRDITQRILQRFGYEVYMSSSGEDAVRFLESNRVDLVVLDMLMPPGINGLETYNRILKIHPDQKAIIVSGYSESKDVKLAMQLGAGAFVKKPYTMHQIAHSVKKELKSNRMS